MRLSRGGASQMMIGRERELRHLAQLASSRHPGVAMLAGEPGIGKTRLVRELLAQLPPETVVLVGHAEPDSLARPFELLLDALDRSAAADEADLQALSDPARSPVERLHTALSIVSGLTAERPAVFVFEDLHWVDSESAALFERLADEPGARLLLGTYRPDEVTSRHPVASLLARLERRGVDHLRLERLTVDDTAAFLASVTGAPVPYRVAKAMYQRTGGNPFFLEELLRGYDGRDLEALCDMPLPWNLADVVRRQAAELDPHHRQIVEAAAVLGNRVPFDLLATVTGESEHTLIAALRELVTRGVLVESGEDVFTFRHALVREALTGQMLGRQRRRLHEAALGALLAAGQPDPALVAHHARAAGRYDEMVAAARRGAASYLAIGSAYQALRLAELGLAEDGDDLEFLAAAARSAWLAGLVDDADRYARRWHDVAADAGQRADALNMLIKLAWEDEDLERVPALTRELEALIDQIPPGPHLARAMTAVAQSHLGDDPALAVRWADRALAAAGDDDHPERLAALAAKGVALIQQPGDASVGRGILTGLVDDAEQHGEWVLAARALYTLVSLPPETESLTAQAETLERMRVNAERAGLASFAVAAYFQGRARLAMREGDLTAAVEALEQGWAREHGYEPRGYRARHHGVFLAGLYLESGDLSRVEQVVEALAAVARFLPRVLPGISFHLACRRGDLAAAEKHLEEVWEMLAGQAWRSGSQTHDLVSAALHAGLALPTVRRLAEASLPVLDDEWRRLVDAQLAEAGGQTAAALVGYREVIEAAVPPAIRGTAHTAVARCLHALGRTEEAAKHADEAARLLARWGGWRVAELAAVQAGLGLAPVDGQVTVTGTAALTPREREVALLVSEGLTNAELARRLYISPRTAAVHVSNILRKLGVAARTEVRGALERPH